LAQRDGAECALRAIGRQLDADACDVARSRAPILIKRSRMVANSQPASGLLRGLATTFTEREDGFHAHGS